MSITRRLPQSEKEVWNALMTASLKKDGLISGTNILTPNTSTKLDAMVILFGDARNDNIVKQSASHKSTSDKDLLLHKQRMLNSHYIQSLNMHIEEEIFPNSFRTFYGIPMSSGAVPTQKNLTEINRLSRNIIDGEPLMIAAGGSAIPFPTLKRVQDNYNLLQPSETSHSNAIDAANHAQQALTALLPNAVTVVKKVWDEVETYYNEGSNQSKRKNSRQWGVVYIHVGEPTVVTCHVVEVLAGVTTAVKGMEATIVETGETTVSNQEGGVILKTNAVDSITLRFEMEGYQTKTISCELGDGTKYDAGIITVVRIPV